MQLNISYNRTIPKIRENISFSGIQYQNVYVNIYQPKCIR